MTQPRWRDVQSCGATCSADRCRYGSPSGWQDQLASVPGDGRHHGPVPARGIASCLPYFSRVSFSLPQHLLLPAAPVADFKRLPEKRLCPARVSRQRGAALIRYEQLRSNSMSQPAANCPNCGALVQFRWSGAVQTTCEFCRSILVRRDVDLKKVGEVADLPRDASPIQIGTEGDLSEQSLQCRGPHSLRIRTGRLERVAHRLQRRRQRLARGRQLEYDLLMVHPASGAVAGSRSNPSGALSMERQTYDVTSRTHAPTTGVARRAAVRILGQARSCSSRISGTTSGDFATIDYSEAPPLLFLGRAVEFDDLQSAKAFVNSRAGPDAGGSSQVDLVPQIAAARWNCAASPTRSVSCARGA